MLKFGLTFTYLAFKRKFEIFSNLHNNVIGQIYYDPARRMDWLLLEDGWELNIEDIKSIYDFMAKIKMH